MLGSLSVANSAVSSENVAVVEPVEFDQSAVYIRYNTGPRPLPWGTPALIRERSVYSDSNFIRKYLLVDRILVK
jgi:hypothetical protein